MRPTPATSLRSSSLAPTFNDNRREHTEAKSYAPTRTHELSEELSKKDILKILKI
jgi:hypothetical protein